jgi:hypothetical protein
MKKIAALSSALSLVIAVSASAQVSDAFKGGVANTAAPSGAPNVFQPNATITQGFDSVGAGTAPGPTYGCELLTGWTCRNNSPNAATSNAPVGWGQGISTNFPGQAGAATSWVRSGFNATTLTNDTSAWLVSPVVQFGTGSSLEFWIRKNVSNFNDRLEVRVSTTTGPVNVGTAVADVGDFTTLLFTANPTFPGVAFTCPATGVTNTATISALPSAGWCRITINTVGGANGIPASGSGRIAFRMNTPSSGPDGTNGDVVGVDTFSFVEGAAGAAITSSPASGSSIRLSVPVGGSASATISFAGGPGTLTCTAPAGFTLSSATVTVPGTLTITSSGVASGTLTCTGGGFTGTYGLSSALAVQAPALNTLGMLGLLAGIALLGVFAVRRYS